MRGLVLRPARYVADGAEVEGEKGWVSRPWEAAGMMSFDLEDTHLQRTIGLGRYLVDPGCWA
jgi:hypothetical protein